jgi:hypothetical protein
MTVTLREHLDGHTEIASGLPQVGACLHKPRRRRLAGDECNPFFFKTPEIESLLERKSSYS